MSAFSYGWADAQNTESFWIRFDRCKRNPSAWKEEVYAAARDIAEKTAKPIWVCSSGGLDSEIACRAFYEQNIPFSVLTLEYEGGSNGHDIRFATRWFETHNVKQKIVNIDMQKFLQTCMDTYGVRY